MGRRERMEVENMGIKGRMRGSEKYGKKWEKECNWKNGKKRKNGSGKYEKKEEKELKWKIDYERGKLEVS